MVRTKLLFRSSKPSKLRAKSRHVQPMFYMVSEAKAGRNATAATESKCVKCGVFRVVPVAPQG